MINRGAILLRYKPPAVRWINEADPYPDGDSVTIEEVNREITVYLISDETAEGGDTVESWIQLNFKVLFEDELNGWYTDPSLWPQDLTYELFCQWFSVECHSVVIDTVEGAIYEYET